MARAMSLEGSIVEGEADLDTVWGEWDALAVAAGMPFHSPAWVLAWWRHMRPPAAALRVVLVRDGDRLAGVAPLFVGRADRSRAAYEFLAGALSPPLGPLAEPGREAEVSAAAMAALAAARPAPSRLRVHETVGPGSPTECLVAGWPGRRPWIHTTPPIALPIVSLEGLDYERWLAGQHRKFRQEARRRRRLLERAGASFALASPSEMEAAVDAFLELHAARWKGRGGSKVMRPGIGPMLREAARELPEGRLRIFTAAVEGRVVAASVLVAAGLEVSGWSGGFDPAWSRHAPQLQLLLEAIADAAARGEKRMSLGPGGAPAYKGQLVDSLEYVATTTVVPRGPFPLARLGLAARQARWAITERLPVEQKQRLKRLAGRLR